MEADVAVVALGAAPNTEWLAGSGLELQPGVVCDATLAARGADGVFCAGDAAAWPHPMAGGDVIRIEHWTNAAEQGAAAARNLLAAPGERMPYAAVPYFWSDQYDVKIQAVGLAGLAPSACGCWRRRPRATSSCSAASATGGWSPSSASTPRAGSRSTAGSSRTCRRSTTSSRRRGGRVRAKRASVGGQARGALVARWARGRS